jgi:aspartyl-tRNA(Asn)/glutamyl-tRNA(Gln) amidotransferase subunit B
MELPTAKRERYVVEYLLTEYDSGVLIQDKEIALYFEDLIKINEGRVEIKKIANWVINDLLSELKTKDKTRGKDKEEKVVNLVKSEDFLGLILEVEAGNINKNTGKTVLAEMLLSGKKAGEIIKEKNLAQVSDEKGIGDIIEHVLEENPKELAGLISGKDKLFGFFVGAVMKKTKGKANPKKVNEILKKSIAEKIKGFQEQEKGN